MVQEDLNEGNCNKTMDDIKQACPFASKCGYATKSARQEYLDQHHLDSTDVPSAIEGDVDITKPLYFWQIHSLTGQEPLFSICSDFYDLVYDDEDAPWFKVVFQRAAPQNHHILAQAAYWIDAMGGGRLYMGGHARLNFHHHHNAHSIMNAKGARQWMHYMKQSLKKNRHYFDHDPRILPAIMEFLRTKMRSYAMLHDWDFDDGDDYELSSIWEETTASKAEC
jgi:truncated hemoglobin YjbI